MASVALRFEVAEMFTNENYSLKQITNFVAIRSEAFKEQTLRVRSTKCSKILNVLRHQVIEETRVLSFQPCIRLFA